MSGTFKGFSDHDIKKIKNGFVDSPKSDQQTVKSAKLIKNKRINNKVNCSLSESPLQSVTMSPIPENAKLSKVPFKCSTNYEQMAEMNANDTIQKVNVHANGDLNELNNNKDESISFQSDNETAPSSLKSEIETLTLESIDISKCDKPINLEEFQNKQKLMEEQNRRRKEFISKALADRTKQTTEEVQRLEKIKKELQTLDNRLSLDVCILRKQIDQASLSFAEAEKHYNKAESEFLAAKISMHKEREKKEQLTEHLCAIIAHNEARKAKKLEDLMEKLNDGIGKRTVVDGVCEQTGKMLELDENGEVIKDDDDD